MIRILVARHILMEKRAKYIVGLEREGLVGLFANL